ncbi:MAG: ABC transporter ATP-binding protein/permease [Bacteroidales bacterium]|nr:ABC transporter ATP-binding protein/permease [Bacteroidales bacterium]
MKEVVIVIQRLFWLVKQIGRRNQIHFSIAFFMVVIASFIIAYIPEAIGRLVDNFSKTSFPVNGLIIIGSLYLLNEIFTYIRKFCVEKASTDAWNQLTILNVRHLLYIDLYWLKNQELGGLNARFQRSIDGAIRLLKISFMDLIPAMLTMLFAVIVALNNSIIIGISISLVAPIAFYIINRQIHSQKGIRISLNRAIETIQAKLIEMLMGIDTIRAANYEEKQLDKIKSFSDNVKVTEFKHHKAMMTFDTLKGINKAFWNLAVLVICLYFLKEGQISVGQVFTFLLLFNNVIKPLADFHRFMDESSEASILTGDLIEILNVPEDKIYAKRIVTAKSNSNIERGQPLVSVKNFSFGYNGTTVIRNVSLALESGKFYGIVGESGCGKSTLIKNIIGFDFGSGTLNLHGIEISQLPRNLLAETISYAPQRPFILTGTFRENILFGCKSEYNDQEIIEAAEKAQIHNLINASQYGLDSLISPSGNNLSGGEAQRICLARVFLNKQCDLIILDEGTSALDNLTENKIYQNLFELTKEGKTVVSIAHRLDTLQSANTIFVMDKGEIIQYGTFDNLRISDGIFQSLLKREIEYHKEY